MGKFWIPGDSDFAKAARGWPSSPVERPTVKAALNRDNEFGEKCSALYWFDKSYEEIEGRAGQFNWRQKHPTGHRGLVKDGVWFYADHAGVDDDEGEITGLKAITSYPAGQRKKTFVMEFTLNANDRDQSIFNGGVYDDNLGYWGLYVRCGVSWASQVGFSDGNGAGHYGSWNVGNSPFVIGKNVVIVSMNNDTGAEALTIWVNGQTLSDADSIYGTIGYMDYITRTGGDTTLHFGDRGFNNYYHMNGTFHLLAMIDAYYEQDKVDYIARNYYDLLKPANDTPYLISVPAGGGVPTLSLPGVTGVQATQATPQVTLTF